VREFIQFYLAQGPALVSEVGYVPLPERAYLLALKRFEDRKLGSIFGGEGSQVGVSVEELLKQEGQ